MGDWVAALIEVARRDPSDSSSTAVKSDTKSSSGSFTPEVISRPRLVPAKIVGQQDASSESSDVAFTSSYYPRTPAQNPLGPSYQVSLPPNDEHTAHVKEDQDRIGIAPEWDYYHEAVKNRGDDGPQLTYTVQPTALFVKNEIVFDHANYNAAKIIKTPAHLNPDHVETPAEHFGPAHRSRPLPTSPIGWEKAEYEDEHELLLQGIDVEDEDDDDAVLLEVDCSPDCIRKHGVEADVKQEQEAVTKELVPAEVKTEEVQAKRLVEAVETEENAAQYKPRVEALVIEAAEIPEQKHLVPAEEKAPEVQTKRLVEAQETEDDCSDCQE
jgi:hypothetical protein